MAEHDQGHRDAAHTVEFADVVSHGFDPLASARTRGEIAWRCGLGRGGSRRQAGAGAHRACDGRRRAFSGDASKRRITGCFDGSHEACLTPASRRSRCLLGAARWMPWEDSTTWQWHANADAPRNFGISKRFVGSFPCSLGPTTDHNWLAARRRPIALYGLLRRRGRVFETPAASLGDEVRSARAHEDTSPRW